MATKPKPTKLAAPAKGMPMKKGASAPPPMLAKAMKGKGK